MQKTILTISIILLSTCFFIQPAVAKPDKEKVAATVNGVKISIDEIDRAVKGLPKYREMQNFVLENIIVSKLLFQECEKKGIKVEKSKVDAEFQEYLKLFPAGADVDAELKKIFGATKEEVRAEIEEKLTIQKYVEQRTEKLNITVTDAEAQAYFDAQPNVFNVPERTRPSQILLKCGPAEPVETQEKVKKKILSIKKRINEGEYFADLAKQYSEHASKAQGGDIGFISRTSQLDKEFIKAAFDLKVGDVSGPVKSIYGYHLITVTEKKAAMKLSFNETKDRIKQEILKQKKDSVLKEYVNGLIEKAKIDVFLGKKRKK